MVGYFSEWTVDTGHNYNRTFFGLTSVTNTTPLECVSRDYVQAGQAIAFSGNTGELSTGPHLHFELWSNGNPVDPLEYISFE